MIRGYGFRPSPALGRNDEMETRCENGLAYPPPRSETERGRGTMRSMVEGAPLPPSLARFASFGWSPLPAIAGREGESAVAAPE
jgi:hypothetical protein